MRRFGLLVFAAAPLLLGAWTLATPKGVPTCTPTEKKSPYLIVRDGWMVACGPGRAYVRLGYAPTLSIVTRGTCITGTRGGRLYFGARINGPDATSAPHRYLNIDVEPRRRNPRIADIIDGSLGVVSADGQLHLAVIGTARVFNGVQRGSFTVYEHAGYGVMGKRRFTGSWDCGKRQAFP